MDEPISLPKGSTGTLKLLALIVVGALLASVILHWAEDKSRRWRQRRLSEGKSTIPFVSKQYPPQAGNVSADADAYDPAIYN